MGRHCVQNSSPTPSEKRLTNRITETSVAAFFFVNRQILSCHASVTRSYFLNISFAELGTKSHVPTRPTLLAS